MFDELLLVLTPLVLPTPAPAAVGVDGGLLWLLVQLLFVGGFEGHLPPAGGPTLVGEGVIGGSFPSSSALIGGVRMTVLRKTRGFNLRSSSSSISSVPLNVEEHMGGVLLLLLLLPMHLRLASGVGKLRPTRPLLAPVEGRGKGREEGGTLDPAVLPRVMEGDLR